MKVVLVDYSQDGDYKALCAARVCYSAEGFDEISNNMIRVSKSNADYLNDKNLKLLHNIIKSGHTSVTEHVQFTFSIEGISRACSHQLVRHRIASYSQQSQRYVEGKNFSYVTPPEILADEKAKKAYDGFMQETYKFYETLVNTGVKKEDARFVLPNACTTNIVVSMNARELLNFFKLRCCNRAQWEIREVAKQMMKACKEVCPVIFMDAGPDCANCKEHNKCYEGKAN